MQVESYIHLQPTELQPPVTRLQDRKTPLWKKRILLALLAANALTIAISIPLHEKKTGMTPSRQVELAFTQALSLPRFLLANAGVVEVVPNQETGEVEIIPHTPVRPSGTFRERERGNTSPYPHNPSTGDLEGSRGDVMNPYGEGMQVSSLEEGGRGMRVRSRPSANPSRDLESVEGVIRNGDEVFVNGKRVRVLDQCDGSESLNWVQVSIPPWTPIYRDKEKYESGRFGMAIPGESFMRLRRGWMAECGIQMGVGNPIPAAW